MTSEPLNTTQHTDQEVAMTQSPTVAAQPAPFLSERENQRAVDLIESAERSAPYCLCGAHMIAIERDGEVWLECAEQRKEKRGFRAILSRLSFLGHTRQLIMELPRAN